MINEQWCDAKITKIIPPTQEEIDKDKEEQEDDDVSNIPVWRRNRSISAGIKPVLSYSENSYYIQFSTNIKKYLHS